MKKSIILFFMLMGSICISNAQKECSKIVGTPSTAKINTITESGLGENEHPYGGTFQFIISKNTASKEIFTDEVLTLIENNRLENDEKTLVLSPNTKVRILSRQQISRSDFQPLTKLYIIE